MQNHEFLFLNSRNVSTLQTNSGKVCSARFHKKLVASGFPTLCRTMPD
eukprot:CAMPEP_0170311616 /NCGR_PEP_ID=MMETSP0116_2-20130129/56324_1 /TAXON_ID=400756 /ORGANISM="Durinskia baltica, Strain CSIRO CS-38" /LENGTH=47 /DNA_ID= /DNA_START= /DNA_END= /DNA_ORIENTATION=